MRSRWGTRAQSPSSDLKSHELASPSWSRSSGIPIDERGYVNVADMLKWPKMSKELNATFEEILEEVKSNDKQRFALLHISSKALPSKEQSADLTQDDGLTELTGRLSLTSAERDQHHIDRSEVRPEDQSSPTPPTAPATTTAAALEHAYSAPDINPSHFLIRATQGHSIKNVTPSAYLTPISPDSPSSVPETVVHGTFYAAWDRILGSGGLKAMSRTHVHFATGPSLQMVLDSDKKETLRNSPALLGDTKAVISGMRSDAQILIYIDVRRALEMGVPFWVSENGVVLYRGCG
ncbi:RNA 2'-phosphotransferase [bacterium]|nr:RNA 2'-phosphotransferase [bacterium]